MEYLFKCSAQQYLKSEHSEQARDKFEHNIPSNHVLFCL